MYLKTLPSSSYFSIAHYRRGSIGFARPKTGVEAWLRVAWFASGSLSDGWMTTRRIWTYEGSYYLIVPNLCPARCCLRFFARQKRFGSRLKCIQSQQMNEKFTTTRIITTTRRACVCPIAVGIWWLWSSSYSALTDSPFASRDLQWYSLMDWRVLSRRMYPVCLVLLRVPPGSTPLLNNPRAWSGV